jgi:hypothetical protein
MSYHLGALSLREHLPASVPAVVVERGEIVVAAVASAWGAWSGLDAEVPAVEAAIETLLERAESPPLWDSALRDAFHAATHRLDSLPITPINEELGLYPCTSLACAVVTPKGIWVGWTGGVVACVIQRAQILRETVPHTLFAEFEELKNKEYPGGLRDTIARGVGSSRDTQSDPDIVCWPPLEPNSRLLLAQFRLVKMLRFSLPQDTIHGEQWLREALSINTTRNVDGQLEFGDRVGLIVEHS